MRPVLDNFGDRLRKALEIASITQSKLAALIGTSQSAVSQWLAGKKEPSPENLSDLAKHLKVERRWLVEGIPPMKAYNPDAEREVYKRVSGWDSEKPQRTTVETTAMPMSGHWTQDLRYSSARFFRTQRTLLFH